MSQICVSIGRTRHKMVVREHQALAERGAELVELRLDWLSRLPDVGRLIQDRPTPVVVTCRRPVDRGRWRGNEQQRITLLRAAIVEGVEYVDLEEDVARQIPRYGPTKRIVSHHDFRETPDNLEQIYKRLAQLDPDVIKIVTMANSPQDIVSVLRLVANADIPTVGFCMGDFGIPSRVLCGKYGSPFTYASFSEERELAPGQISFDMMKSMYRFHQINADTKVFGVLGDPIAHSFSPLIHNAAFRAMKMNCVYLPLRVPQDLLLPTLQAFDWLDIRGYSVTIPHKETVMEMADVMPTDVREIGAANTLCRNEENKWVAANTDYRAVVESVKTGYLSDEISNIDDVSLSGKQGLVLGTGGAARATIFGLLKEGVGVTVAGRKRKKVQALAEEMGCQQSLWENRGANFADIVVNCTPVGMHPNIDETPYPGHWLREGALVFDTVYNPETTYLLRQSKERELRTVSGIEMFVRQAARQFQLFTGEAAPLSVMRDAIRREISPVHLSALPKE